MPPTKALRLRHERAVSLFYGFVDDFSARYPSARCEMVSDPSFLIGGPVCDESCA